MHKVATHCNYPSGGVGASSPRNAAPRRAFIRLQEDDKAKRFDFVPFVPLCGSGFGLLSCGLIGKYSLPCPHPTPLGFAGCAPGTTPSPRCCRRSTAPGPPSNLKVTFTPPARLASGSATL